jgi:hypothetical protein
MQKRAAAFSLTLHLAALLVVMPPRCTSSETDKTEPPPDQRHKSSSIVFMGISDTGTVQCQSSYTGFGVLAGPTGRVFDVAQGSPADRAMILAGDIIENAEDFWPNALPEGTEITLRVVRNGVLTIKKLRIGPICYG